MSEKIYIAGIDDESITNGPGLRFVVFAQGCPHRCPGCHNPETHAFGTGTAYTPEEVFERMRRNPLVMGVTFSGGEPFSQAAALLLLARMVKETGLELAVYSGYTFEQLIAMGDSVMELLKLADVLVDGQYKERERNLMLRFRGSANQRILDVKASLAAGRAILMPVGRWRQEEYIHNSVNPSLHNTPLSSGDALRTM